MLHGAGPGGYVPARPRTREGAAQARRGEQGKGRTRQEATTGGGQRGGGWCVISGVVGGRRFPNASVLLLPCHADLIPMVVPLPPTTPGLGVLRRMAGSDGSTPVHDFLKNVSPRFESYAPAFIALGVSEPVDLAFVEEEDLPSLPKFAVRRIKAAAARE